MDVSDQLHAPVALLLGYPVERRLVGPQSQSGQVAERKNPIIAPAGN